MISGQLHLGLTLLNQTGLISRFFERAKQILNVPKFRIMGPETLMARHKNFQLMAYRTT